MTVQNGTELALHDGHDVEVVLWPVGATVVCEECQEVLIEMFDPQPPHFRQGLDKPVKTVYDEGLVGRRSGQ